MCSSHANTDPNRNPLSPWLDNQPSAMPRLSRLSLEVMLRSSHTRPISFLIKYQQRAFNNNGPQLKPFSVSNKEIALFRKDSSIMPQTSSNLRLLTNSYSQDKPSQLRTVLILTLYPSFLIIHLGNLRFHRL
jgi:hypothetical protein